MAYLRRSRRRKNGEVYESWAIVESVRTARGPRQRTISTLGKAPGLDEEERMGWEDIARQLRGDRGARRLQPDLFESPRTEPEVPNWATVDLNRVRIERLRRFGDVYLALALWHRLGLDEFFEARVQTGREEIAWSLTVCLLCVARFCEPSSELAIAESWFERTALEDLLGMSGEKVNDDRLYRALDAMLPHREALFAHLRRVYGEMFGATFDVLLYDVTSTFFEGQAAKNDLAAYGYSRDKRPDCLQVCIGLVVTPEGLPLAYEVFTGNRADSTTLEEIVDLMEQKYGRARRTWVVDRGMISEANLAMLRRRGATYICGTPRSMLRRYECALLEENWEKVEYDIEVKLADAPAGENEEGETDPGGRETFLLCRSRARMGKDRAIVQRAAGRLEKKLTHLKEQIERGRLRNRVVAERRVGRLFGKYSRAAGLFAVTIGEINDPGNRKKKRLTIEIVRSKEAEQWVALQNGCYLLRTNLTDKGAAELWRAYIGLAQAEDAFRQLKSPLQLRPIYHQRTDRVQAHILVCFLALAMRRALASWMQASGLGNSVQKLIDELKEIRSLDVILTVKNKKEIRLRVVSTPPQRTRVLLHHLQLKLPNRPKCIQNVVATFAPAKNYPKQNQSSEI